MKRHDTEDRWIMRGYDKRQRQARFTADGETWTDWIDVEDDGTIPLRDLIRKSLFGDSNDGR